MAREQLAEGVGVAGHVGREELGVRAPGYGGALTGRAVSHP
jgi:hypothetical protein